MIPDDLPLFELYRLLRERDVQLGIDEYLLVLRALQSGFGSADRAALERLCRTVWVKSEEEGRIFHRVFSELLQESEDRKPAMSGAISLDYRIIGDSPLGGPVHSPLPSPSSPLSSREPVSAPETALKPSLGTSDLNESDKVVKAFRRGTDAGENVVRPQSMPSQSYYPVTRRQMRQSWRNLRMLVREGSADELDISATVEKMSREGILLGPVLMPRRVNRARLVLMLDQGGSMAPFHSLTRSLVETAQRGGKLGRAGTCYFHDYPANYLYRDAARSNAISLSDALAEIDDRAAVLVVSDAGAARGNLEAERIQRTLEFIQRLRQSVRHCAWLNPMPAERWQGTSAAEIARTVPMLEMNRRGLDQAIQVLRGYYVYSETP